MDNGVLEPLLNKAKEFEKKYEWLQATKLYQKATNLALKEKDLSKAAELQERLGFCFYRAAFQAETNAEYRKSMNHSVQAYKKESQLLAGDGIEEHQTRIEHALGLVAYAQSWLETKPSEKKKLLEKWWTLENRTLAEYERVGNLCSVGKVCNDMMQYSIYHRIHLVSNRSEKRKLNREMFSLGEKAVKIFSKLNDDYELARAYCFASIYHGTSKSEDKIRQLMQKRVDYSRKALELSLKTENEWLIGWSYIAAYHAESSISAFSETAVEFGEKIIEFGTITKDKLLIGRGNSLLSACICLRNLIIEDPEKRKESLEKAREMSGEAIHDFKIISHLFVTAYYSYIFALRILSGQETDSEKKRELLELATKALKEGIQLFQGWNNLLPTLFNAAAELYGWHLSGTKSELEKKKEMLRKGIHYRRKTIAYSEQMSPSGGSIYSYMQLANLQFLLARIETDNKKKIGILKRAVKSAEKSIGKVEKERKVRQGQWARGSLYPWTYFNLSGILGQIYSLTKEKKTIIRAIEAQESGIKILKSTNLTARLAESYWYQAQFFDLMGDQKKASQNYESAAEAYTFASKKIPQLAEFYGNHSAYMRAWSQIELGRYSHSIEDYQEAREYYEKAADLHASSEFWSYLVPNYLAWARVEEAEGFSRRENTQQAKQTFQKAYDHFCKAEEYIKRKLEEITSVVEKDMVQKLLKASDLRRKYCQIRIRVEEAKLLDRQGKYLESSKGYGEAAQNISSIVGKIDVEAERRELELLATLCLAWERMATAEERASSESYLEAAKLFEQAKDYCYTRKASLWALGNSSFCKGLAAGIEFQSSLDFMDHATAKGHLESAATSYLHAGFKGASEYTKATQRLFDAYVYMNEAESEVDQEKRAKQYQIAENLLQISAGSFLKAKQPEKTAQVQKILKKVREEKALAVSLTEVMHAPTVTSSTFSFTAPTPTNEASVGLESFEHANVQANLIAAAKEVKVGESFCLTVEFINAGREPALLTRIEEFIPPGFIVVKKPEIYRLEDNCLNLKGRQLAPLKLVEAKLVLQPTKKGVYDLKPKVHYLGEHGQKELLKLKSLEIKVEEVILADRVSTGTKELDSILLGGIPEGYAVVLTGSPSDERETLIKNFVQAGVEVDQITFYIALETVGFERQLEKHPTTFSLFLCNAKPKGRIPDLPNIHQLGGPTDLTNLSIAFSKAYRKLDQKIKGPKRVCIEIVSDVLVDYGVRGTRKWVSELITNLGRKGFTILGVMNPNMHPSDQATAVLDLFDGEISLYQSEDPTECNKSIQVKKLRNQDYIKNPACLIKK